MENRNNKKAASVRKLLIDTAEGFEIASTISLLFIILGGIMANFTNGLKTLSTSLSFSQIHMMDMMNSVGSGLGFTFIVGASGFFTGFWVRNRLKNPKTVSLQKELDTVIEQGKEALKIETSPVLRAWLHFEIKSAQVASFLFNFIFPILWAEARLLPHLQNASEETQGGLGILAGLSVGASITGMTVALSAKYGALPLIFLTHALFIALALKEIFQTGHQLRQLLGKNPAGQTIQQTATQKVALGVRFVLALAMLGISAALMATPAGSSALLIASAVLAVIWSVARSVSLAQTLTADGGSEKADTKADLGPSEKKESQVPGKKPGLDQGLRPVDAPENRVLQQGTAEEGTAEVKKAEEASNRATSEHDEAGAPVTAAGLS